MKRTLLFLALVTFRAEEPKPAFHKAATETHGDSEVIVERYRDSEGTEQIWLASTADPAKRHLLYTHHRQAGVDFSDDDYWLVINDHAGSAGSSSLIYRRKAPLVYEQVTDLCVAAWKFFDQRNGLKTPRKGKIEEDYDKSVGLEANPFDHRYVDAVCWVDDSPPTLLIRLHGYKDDHSHTNWLCLYDVRAKSFSTNFDAHNKKNTKLEAK